MKRLVLHLLTAAAFGFYALLVANFVDNQTRWTSGISELWGFALWGLAIGTGFLISFWLWKRSSITFQLWMIVSLPFVVFGLALDLVYHAYLGNHDGLLTIREDQRRDVLLVVVSVMSFALCRLIVHRVKSLFHVTEVVK